MFAAATLLTASVSAQPIVDSTLFNTVGITFNAYAIIDPGSSDFTLNGAGVLWDFTSAQTFGAGGASFTPASYAPQPLAYPDANVVLNYNAVGYSYAKLSNFKLDMIAENTTNGLTEYSEYRTALQFPFTYQGSFVDTYTEMGGTQQTVTRNYSAYGTVLTPFGSYFNVVKQTSSDGTVVFWNTVPLFPLVTIDPNLGAAFLEPTNIGIIENANAVELAAYPNPATEQLQVLGMEELSTWAVLDATGREVMNGMVQRTRLQQLDVSDLSPGNYHLVARGEGRIGRKAFVVVR